MSTMPGSVTVHEGVLQHLAPCCEAVRDSDLGRTYFADGGQRLENLIREGLAKGEIRVALAADGACHGFIWFSGSGMFYRYPYIRLLAVSSSSRSSGVGSLLLAYAEELFRARQQHKVFLTVADFNLRAKQLYEQLGYREIALVPDLFLAGHAEYVMMKQIPEI